MADTCETCRFWSEGFSKYSPITAPEGFGECRRRAPVGPMTYGSVSDEGTLTTILSAFCLTAEDDWCGEHEPLEPKEESSG